MTDHNATTGVLVTTSWFSRSSEQFAQRNRITLINGAELKHLLNSTWASTSFRELVRRDGCARPTTPRPASPDRPPIRPSSFCEDGLTQTLRSSLPAGGPDRLLPPATGRTRLAAVLGGPTATVLP
jgi:Restriction endonuclease